MTKPKVALQLSSVYRELRFDLPGTFAKIRTLGYEGAEWVRGFEVFEPEAVVKAAKEADLQVISAHVPSTDDPLQVFPQYQRMGCRYFGTGIPYHRMPEEERPGFPKFSMEGLEESIRQTTELGSKLAAEGVTLLFHNHYFELGKVGEKQIPMIDYLLQKVPASVLQTEFDLCWLAAGGVDPADYLRRYAGRIPLVHIKDYYTEFPLRDITPPEDFSLRPLGRGLLDVPAMLQAAQDGGTEWIVVEQDAPTKGLTSMECAKISRECLTSYGL